MRIVQTLMAPIAAPVRKDTLEKESHAEVKLDYDFHAPTSYLNMPLQQTNEQTLTTSK